jgi:MYXO-CTERM domain-containing protein
MKIKNTLKYLPLVLGGMGLFATSANGAVSLENGFLAVAFYQVSSGSVQANTLIYDLGNANVFRENTSSGLVNTINTGLASANLGTQLSTAFGSNWADAGTVRWMIFGSNQAAVNGDSSRTTYLSNIDPNTSITSSSVRAAIANDINTFRNTFQNITSTQGNADAAQDPISRNLSIDEFVPPNATGPATGLYFLQSQNLTKTLGNGTNGSGSAGSSLNVYRVLNSSTGSPDLTSGFGSGNAALGVPQFIGTFALSSSGNLSVIPEPSAALLGLVGAMGLVLRRRRNA